MIVSIGKSKPVLSSIKNSKNTDFTSYMYDLDQVT